MWNHFKLLQNIFTIHSFFLSSLFSSLLLNSALILLLFLFLFFVFFFFYSRKFSSKLNSLFTVLFALLLLPTSIFISMDNNSSHGPCCTGISSLEQWYLLFSFLSVGTSSYLGRPYAWKAIQYLMENNAINDMNFSPCRGLVLRYLQGWGTVFLVWCLFVIIIWFSS